MDANIRRHAYTDYSGRAYIDNHSAPAAVAQYRLPLVQHAPTESRSIIRTNQIDKLYPQPSPRNQYFPPIPQAKCGCDKYGPAPALAPRPKLAPAPRPKLSPAARPKLAPAPAFPKHAPIASPKYAPIPRPKQAPAQTPHVANLINDNGQWAQSARKDNMYIAYAQNC